MTPTDANADPERWTADVLTNHGAVVHVRPISMPDRTRLLKFYEELEPDDVYTRFFSHHLPREELLARPTEQRRTDFTLIVESGEELIGVGGYTWDDGRQSAEVAFAVAHDHQHQGLGTLLLEHLAACARACGIVRFHAHTLPWNRNMLGTFLRAGYVVDTSPDRDEVFVEFVLDDSANDKIDARDQRATAHSIELLLRPETLAVIGASNDVTNEGNAVVRNLTASEFHGAIYPISTADAAVCGITTYPSISATPRPVDVAIIAVPAKLVLDAVLACGDAGVAAAVILSSGFAEWSDAGAEAEAEILRAARSRGMRIVGPNCIGVANTAADTRLAAMVAPLPALPGNVSVATQSGALGVVLVEKLADAGVGMASFASLGNKADISGNDFLQYWETDPATAIGVLYLESFGNPRKFARIASRFCRTKPLIVVTGGRSRSSRNTAADHTASVAADPVLVDALFQELGVINVETMVELIDVTRLLAKQPVPAGNHVAIVSNSAGPAVLAMDACDDAGLQIATLSPDTVADLDHLDTQRRNARATDAVVITSAATDVEPTLDLLLRDPNVDAVVLLYTDVLHRGIGGVTDAVQRASDRESTKTVAATLISPDQQPPAIGDVPMFDFPEDAISAIGHAARLGTWRNRPSSSPSRLERFDLDAARAVLTASLSDAERQAADAVDLNRPAIEALLDALGIEIGTEGERPPEARAELVGVVDPLFGPVVSLSTNPSQHSSLVRACALAPLAISAATQLARNSGLPCVEPSQLADVAQRLGAALDGLSPIVELRLPLNLASGGLVDASGATCRIASSQTGRFVPRRRLKSSVRAG